MTFHLILKIKWETVYLKTDDGDVGGDNRYPEKKYTSHLSEQATGYLIVISYLSSIFFGGGNRKSFFLKFVKLHILWWCGCCSV